MKRLALIAMCISPLALADTGYYLVTTYDVEQQTSIDFKYWNAHYNGRTVAAPELGIGYGVTSRWYTELYAKWVKLNGAAGQWVQTDWQNDFLLTQGQYAFDLALHTRVARARDSNDGYTIEWGPALQTEYYRTQFNANLFFQRDLRVNQPAATASSDARATALTYQLQVKHNWRPWLQPGVQAFGEVGQWNHWLPYRQQSHRAGPMVYGHRDVGQQEVKYEFAYLIGRNSARAAKSVTLRVQWLF